MTEKSYVIVPFGGPGSGKSTLCNFLIDGKNSGKFKTSDTTDGSETTEITHHTNWILGDKKLKKKVQIFDTPGLGAPDLTIDDWVGAVKEGVPENQQIDMALVVLKATDKRMGFE
jgi:ribosome biogenesis GTPase A